MSNRFFFLLLFAFAATAASPSAVAALVLRALGDHGTPLWKTLRGIAATHVFSPRSLAAAQGARERAMQRMLKDFLRHVGQVVDIGHVLYHGMFDLLTNTLFSVDGQDQLRTFSRTSWAFSPSPTCRTCTHCFGCWTCRAFAAGRPRT
ncbi:hypothetical protein ZWY2020_023693 [Hordeum vulgare]|nr:hypothetical protein ZWY2020_023693 [Hordeum vulgare]